MKCMTALKCYPNHITQLVIYGLAKPKGVQSPKISRFAGAMYVPRETNMECHPKALSRDQIVGL